ncbi:MAG: hypothetical protein ACRDDZ_01615 [Marinifilaceae bacterium]
MSEWNIIYTSNTPQQMGVVKAALEAEGFETRIRDMHTAVTGYGAAIGGAKLLVKKEVYDEAMFFLKEANFISPDADNDLQDDTVYLVPMNQDKGRCPFCNSKNIEKFKYSNPIMRLVALFMAIFISLYRNNLSCEDCGKKWKYV